MLLQEGLRGFSKDHKAIEIETGALTVGIIQFASCRHRRLAPAELESNAGWADFTARQRFMDT